MQNLRARAWGRSGSSRRVLAWICRLCAAFVVTGIISAHIGAADERIALVIGNSKYGGNATLRNPTNDADALAAALEDLNFSVILKHDVDLSQLDEAVVQFRRALKKGSAALFFYAGHGLQVKGENYLVPLNAQIKEEFQVKSKCYQVDQILSAMEESESALKVVILDCCRDNPFARSWTRGASSRGLASIAEVPEGTIVAFSTAPGQTAADGSGKNSPYTAHLVASLRTRPQEGLELKEALFEASRGLKKEIGQAPWLNLEASLDKFYLWREGDPSSTRTATILDPSNWTKHWETKGNWSLVDGVATLTPRSGEIGYQRYDSYLWAKKPYGDFEIEFEYAIKEDGNSGFFLRCEDKLDPVRRGIEVQIRNTSGPVNLNTENLDNGGIFPGRPPLKNAGKAGFDWNKYVITCRRDTLTVVLNGEIVNKVDLSQGELARRPRQGFIGFQDSGTPVWLRNIKIRGF